MLLTDYLPAPVRKVIYSVLATVSVVEGVLDAADAGLIPERTQGIAVGLDGRGEPRRPRLTFAFP
jgi:hypothetical protein